VFRWQRILDDLEAYRLKRPANPISTLENYILVDMNRLTSASCSELTRPGNGARRSGDYFLAKQIAIEAEVRSRCRIVSSDQFGVAYAKLAGAFNKRLAGRFPFVDTGNKDKLDWLAAPDASPEAIRRVYQQFDKLPESLRSTLGDGSKAGDSDISSEVLEFLEQLAAVREFLVPWIEFKPGEPPPEFAFAVDFRVGRKKEIGGNQIIEWSLNVGQQQIRRFAKDSKGAWQYGEPVTLSLRWATGSKTRPQADPTRLDMQVKGRTASFDYPQGWAILKLVRANEKPLPIRQSGVVVPGDTLSLAVPLKPALDTGADKQVAVGKARVYVLLSLLGPKGSDDEGKVLEVPPFPALAPEFMGLASSR
jgi:type VI secretion system protein ImpL